MDYKKYAIAILMILVPLSLILAAVFEVVSGKNQPTLYILLVAIPGSIVAGIRALEEFGFLLPHRLETTLSTDKAEIESWNKGMIGSEVGWVITDLIIPIRVVNKDRKNSVDIFDVEVSSADLSINLESLELSEITLGSEKKWCLVTRAGAYDPERIFNYPMTKSIEPTKVADFKIIVREHGPQREKYDFNLSFKDNFGRRYSEDFNIA